jgi:hypothetical protein
MDKLLLLQAFSDYSSRGLGVLEQVYMTSKNILFANKVYDFHEIFVFSIKDVCEIVFDFTLEQSTIGQIILIENPLRVITLIGDTVYLFEKDKTTKSIRNPALLTIMNIFKSPDPDLLFILSNHRCIFSVDVSQLELRSAI